MHNRRWERFDVICPPFRSSVCLSVLKMSMHMATTCWKDKRQVGVRVYMYYAVLGLIAWMSWHWRKNSRTAILKGSSIRFEGTLKGLRFSVRTVNERNWINLKGLIIMQTALDRIIIFDCTSAICHFQMLSNVCLIVNFSLNLFLIYPCSTLDCVCSYRCTK